jgi:Glycosyl hydrolases family 18
MGYHSRLDGQPRSDPGPASSPGPLRGGRERDRHRLWPAVQELEGRRLLATFAVTSTADPMIDGKPTPGTLRWAVEQADSDKSDSTIDGALKNDTITAVYSGAPDSKASVRIAAQIERHPHPGLARPAFRTEARRLDSWKRLLPEITTGGSPAAPATVSWPSQVYAPYVDMTLYPTPNLTSAMTSAGIKYFTLGFVVADPRNHDKPSWGGYSTDDIDGSPYDMALRSQVSAVRQQGGDVMVSFGGQAGQELAQVITNVKKLERAYQTVITDYDLTRIDFDIEGAAETNHASINRRFKAVAALERQAAAAGRPLNVWLTLPALPTGLDGPGMYVMQSALKYGVKIAGVNLMTMDYGNSAAPDPDDMGQYAIQAAQGLFGQLQGLYGTRLTTQQIWQMEGDTPMIGLNDVTSEVFSLQDAQELAAFAEQVGMGRISMWSLSRDVEDPKGALGYVEDTSSSIVQQPYAFSKTFLAYEN